MKRELQAPPARAPAWVHRAWAQIENGASIKAAARSQDHHHESLRRWIIVGQAERSNDKLRSWYHENNDHARQLGRESMARQRERDPEGYMRRQRESRRRHGRKPEYRGTCTQCGGMMGVDNPEDGICQACRKQKATERDALLVAMWEAGLTAEEMADELGYSTRAVVYQHVDRLRKRGVELRDRRRYPAKLQRYCA